MYSNTVLNLSCIFGVRQRTRRAMPEERKNIAALRSACPIPYLLCLDFFVQKKNAVSKPLKGIFCTVKKDITWHTMTYYSSCNWLLLFFYQQTACFGLNILSPVSFVLKPNKNLLLFFFFFFVIFRILNNSVKSHSCLFQGIKFCCLQSLIICTWK